MENLAGEPIALADVDVDSLGGNFGNGYIAPLRFDGGFTFFGGMALVSAEMGPCFVEVYHPFSGDTVATFDESDGCYINEHSELVEFTVVIGDPDPIPDPSAIPQLGDVNQVLITQGSQGGEAKIVVEIRFAEAFQVDSFFDVFFDIEIDVDQNPSTGRLSQITPLGGATGLGVDLQINCTSFFGCNLLDENGGVLLPNFDQPGQLLDPLGDVEGFVVLIPKDDFIAAAGGGPGPYNAAFQVDSFFDVFYEASFFGDGQTTDFVPNDGSLVVDPNGFGQESLDPVPDVEGNPNLGRFFGES